ncbi:MULTISPECIES: amino acid ABC transporter permease [unclassified Halorubrum]|uniref:amino acid ABC transporter permease n=1 Tax=unclassified Halorubrum TaxID=2642239 RepID=UPI000B986A0E|nr:MULTISPECIES: amino acid ABC transporter permease [unclassified Halorubrum]OYR49434.1 amino acid ABC transporter permease [Halorubrum sp. Eb13]OYR55986.1 amino acid ABC transporter permease [Halorubrum sp. Ea1]
MASATRPATVRERVAAADRSVGRLLLVAAGALFWGWLVVSWVNRWLGGVLVPVGQPLVPAGAVEATLAALPGLAAYASDAAFVVELSPDLARGTWLTVVITAVSLVLGFFIAVPLAVARVYGRFSSWLSLGYTELLRGTPLLAQLFVLYYGLNLASYVPGALSGVFPRNVVWVAILGFTLNGAAYQAEYIRGALESVEEGQITAGRAIGLSKLETIYYVVLPQGLRYAIPSWTNEFVYLIKYSSLAAFITVPELYYRADQIASETFRYTLIFVVTGVTYLALVLTASKLMARVEGAVAIPGLGVEREE